MAIKVEGPKVSGLENERFEGSDKSQARNLNMGHFNILKIFVIQ